MVYYEQGVPSSFGQGGAYNPQQVNMPNFDGYDYQYDQQYGQQRRYGSDQRGTQGGMFNAGNISLVPGGGDL